MEIYKGKYGIGTYVKLKKDFPYYIHTYIRTYVSVFKLFWDIIKV